MTSREKEIQALKSGEKLPAHRVIQMRSAGMHEIRFEFVVRLLRAGLKVDTLSIYWERGHEFVLGREVEDAKRRLVLGRRNRIVGEFPDLWLVCYPADPEVKERVEREIEHMIEQARALRTE
jgi:hypothetical protein